MPVMPVANLSIFGFRTVGQLVVDEHERRKAAVDEKLYAVSK